MRYVELYCRVIYKRKLIFGEFRTVGAATHPYEHPTITNASLQRMSQIVKGMHQVKEVFGTHQVIHFRVYRKGAGKLRTMYYVV